MPNAAKYFLEGFNRTFSPTFQNVLDNLQQAERQRVIMDEQNRREAEERQRELSQSKALEDYAIGGHLLNIPPNPMFPQGLQGQIGGAGYKPYTTQEKLGKLREGLGSNPYQYYNALKEILTPQQDSYSYLKFDQPDGIYGFSENQQKMVKIQDDNPFYSDTIKPTNTTVGYTNGQKIIRKFYSDEDAQKLGLPEGVNYEDIETGFYKAPSGSKTKRDIFDLDKYKQFISKFDAKESKTTKKANDFSTKLKLSREGGDEPPDPTLKSIINDTMNQDEITFYNGMIPSARQYIDQNHYQVFKKNQIPAEFEYTDRVNMRKNFITKVTEDYKDGKLDEGDFKIDYSQFPKPKGMDEEDWEREIEAQTYRSILLWAKLKFNRI